MGRTTKCKRQVRRNQFEFICSGNHIAEVASDCYRLIAYFLSSSYNNARLSYSRLYTKSLQIIKILHRRRLRQTTTTDCSSLFVLVSLICLLLYLYSEPLPKTALDRSALSPGSSLRLCSRLLSPYRRFF